MFFLTIYTHSHIRTHVRICICIYTHMYTHIRTCIHSEKDELLNTQRRDMSASFDELARKQESEATAREVRVCIYMCVSVYVCLYIHVNICIYMYIYINLYIR